MFTQRSHPSELALSGSLVAFTSKGHVWHEPPVHCAEHAHVHPVCALPDTPVACPLQFPGTVHSW